MIDNRRQPHLPRDPIFGALQPRSLTFEQRRKINIPKTRQAEPLPWNVKPMGPSKKLLKHKIEAKPGPRYIEFVQNKSQPSFQRAAKPAAAPSHQKTTSQVIAVKKRAAHQKSLKTLFYGWVMPAMAMLLFVAGAAITVQTFRTNKGVEAQVAGAEVVQTEENPNEDDATTPSEVEPTASQFSNYRVDPGAPRYVKIPDVKVFARTYGLGTDSQGKFRAPNNIYNVGWYDKSARPGENGTVLLDGHSAGVKGNAVFSRLKNVRAGSLIEIERGDGQKISYRVVSAESFPADQLDMKSAVVSVQPGVNGLNIITCDGEYSSQTKTYNNRLLVRAVQE